MISLDFGMDCEQAETVAVRNLCRELAEARQKLRAAEAALKREQEKYTWLLALARRVAFLNVELQDELEGATKEMERLRSERLTGQGSFTAKITSNDQ